MKALRHLGRYPLWALLAALSLSCNGEVAGGNKRDTGVIRDARVHDARGDTGEEDSGFIEEDSGIFADASDVGPHNDASNHINRDATPGGDDTGPNPNNPDNTMIDSDCDGLSDAEEFSIVYPNGMRTDPSNPDTDGDGIPDGIEAGKSGPVPGSGCPAIADADPATRTSPVDADTDRDGIPDGLEDKNHNGKVDPGETDPLLADSDGDGIPDGIEDRNHNGIVDSGETDPARRDTDGDMISDGIEDTNHNGRVDAGETNPLLADTDGDMLPDGAEDTNHNGTREPWETDPRSADTDCDGLSDFEEVMGMTSPVLADTDGDGLNDGLEQGRTMPIPGTMCMLQQIDLNPASQTNATNRDTDGDHVPDGTEDANHNGRVDPGETDPNNPDSDGDMISDGDEIAAGTNPTNPNDPPPDIRAGVLAVCSDRNLKVVNYNENTSGDWTLTTEQSFTYTPLSVMNVPNTFAAAFDDAALGVSGFIIAMPFIAGSPNTPVGQTAAVLTRFAANAGGHSLTVVPRQSARSITSHDGFGATVSGIVDVTSVGPPQDAIGVRNGMFLSASGLTAASVPNLPVHGLPAFASFTFTYEVLIRATEVIVVGSVTDTVSFNDPLNSKGIFLSDLTNGTALARAGAERNKACDPFNSGGAAVTDIMWMSDISGSTDDDRGRIQNGARDVFTALQANNIDFRMGVVQHIQNDLRQGTGNGGHLYLNGFTRDRVTFVGMMGDSLNADGCEFGLSALSEGISRALPATAVGAPEDPLRFRPNALVVAFYVSDEHAQELEPTQPQCFNYAPPCSTGLFDAFTSTVGNNTCNMAPTTAQESCISRIVAPHLAQLESLHALAFAQVVDSTPLSQCNAGIFLCPNGTSQNEPGRGYIDIVNATGGIYYSPCLNNPGATTLTAIVDAITGAASPYRLRSAPISSTIKVGLIRMGTTNAVIVPRDRANGFDYDPLANSIFFRGSMFRPVPGDRVVVSYRIWSPPVQPCGGMCSANQICDGRTGVCTCEPAACAARCGPNQICTGPNCDCACTRDCNGQCGPDQVCNTSTCQCECTPNCGGSCGPGTICNPTTCACECANCGGVCASPLTCNTASCQCDCPANCGGACTGNKVCNPSTCGCTCGASCDQSCVGMGFCDINANCGCSCPNNCGGICGAGSTCNPNACACECASDCRETRGCINRQTCNPFGSCDCYCPPDCGGCGPNETCSMNDCTCKPRV